MKHLRKFNENFNDRAPYTMNPEFQNLNMREFAELVDEGDVWLCAVEGSGPGPISTGNYDIRRIDTNDLMKIGEKGATIVLIDEDGFDSIPSGLRNGCSLAIIPELTPAIQNRLKIFTLE